MGEDSGPSSSGAWHCCHSRFGHCLPARKRDFVSQAAFDIALNLGHGLPRHAPQFQLHWRDDFASLTKLSLRAAARRPIPLVPRHMPPPQPRRGIAAALVRWSSPSLPRCVGAAPQRERRRSPRSDRREAAPVRCSASGGFRPSERVRYLPPSRSRANTSRAPSHQSAGLSSPRAVFY